MQTTPVKVLHAKYEYRFGPIDFDLFRRNLTEMYGERITTEDINGHMVEVVSNQYDADFDEAGDDFYLTLHD